MASTTIRRFELPPEFWEEIATDSRNKSKLRVQAGARSITGGYRPRNEDRCVVDVQRGVFLVVDGVGGQAGGELASEMIARALPDWLGRTAACGWRDVELIEAAANDALESIRRKMSEVANQYPACRHMAATFALVVADDDAVYITHVGDCRVYCWRRGLLEQLTRDQTFVQAAIDSGLLTREEARRHEWRHVVTNTVGIQPLEEDLDVQERAIAEGDRLLLCSDGLTDVLTKEDLQQMLALPWHPQLIADALVDTAVDKGSRDNITCLVIDFQRPKSRPK